MLTIYKYPGDDILIGRQGENNARQVCFDISAWAELYGTEGTVELVYQRPKDAAPYPVVIQRDGSTVIWTITATDTENAGAGRAELRYYVGETLVKSATSIISVSHAMGVPGAVPDPPGQSWLDQVLEAARRAEDAAERAEEGGVNGGQIAQAVEDYLAEHPVQGEGGVYVGSGDMPEGYNVQIDPSGTADTAATQEWVAAQIQAAINATWEASY